MASKNGVACFFVETETFTEGFDTKGLFGRLLFKQSCIFGGRNFVTWNSHSQSTGLCDNAKVWWERDWSNGWFFRSRSYTGDDAEDMYNRGYILYIYMNIWIYVYPLERNSSHIIWSKMMLMIMLMIYFIWCGRASCLVFCDMRCRHLKGLDTLVQWLALKAIQFCV